MGSSQPSQSQVMYWYPVVQQPANLHGPRDMPAPVQVPQGRQAFPQSMKQPVQSVHSQKFAQPTQFAQTAQFAQTSQPTNISQNTQPTQFTQHMGFTHQNPHRESRAAQRQQDFMGQQQASGTYATTASPAMSRDTRTNPIHTDQHDDEPLVRGASWWRRLIWRLPATGRASTVDDSSTSRSRSTESSPSMSPSPAPRRSRRRSRSRETRRPDSRQHRDRRRQWDGPAAPEGSQESLSSRSRSPSRVRARPVVSDSRRYRRRYSESIESDAAAQPQRGHSRDRARERRSLTPDFPDLSSLPSHTTLDSGEPPLSPSIGHDTNQDRRDRHYTETSVSLSPDSRTQSHTQTTEPQEPMEIPQISVKLPQAAVARGHVGRRRLDETDRRVSFDENPVSQSHIIEQISETTESIPGASGRNKLPDAAPRTSAHPEVPPVEPRVLYVEASPSEQSEAGSPSVPSKQEIGSPSVMVAKEEVAGTALANASPESGKDQMSRRSNQTQSRDLQPSSRRRNVLRRRASDADSYGSEESYMPSPPKPFATQTFSGRTSITGRRFGRDSKVSVADSMEVQLSPDETVFPGHKIPPAKRTRRSEARESSSTFDRFRGSEDDIQRG
ncbi:hypothetical protein RB596_006366 [Gaeumannomyces avenae]